MPSLDNATYQLAVQSARIAVQLVVEATTPQGRMGGPAVRALGLDAARGGVAAAVLLRGVHRGGTRTSRASAHRLRAHAQRRPLARRGRGRVRPGAGVGADARRGDGARDDVLHATQRGDAPKGCGLEHTLVLGDGLSPSGVGRVRRVGGGNLHLDVFLRVQTVRVAHVDVVVASRGPAAGAICVEKLVERKLYRGTNDAETVGVVRGGDAFAVSHGVRNSGSGVEQGGRAEVVGEERGEAEGGGVVQVFLALGVELRRRDLAAPLGEGLVFVVAMIRRAVVHSGGRTSSRASALGCVPEFRGGLHVGLLCGDGGRDDGRGLVDGEGELHAVDGAGADVLAGLALALLLEGTLLEELSRVVALEVGRLELLDAPRDALGDGEKKLTRGSHEDENAPALLLVQLVTHAFRQLLEVALGLCIVAVDHEVLEVP